jgi:DNA replication and repair protein RecF
MYLKSLEVTNFRNLKPSKLTFSSGVNIFYGDNAQGKTNFIEAIYLLSFFKSFRAESDSELIQWDQDQARIKAEFDAHSLSIELGSGKKEIRLNNTYKRALEVLGELRVAAFSPEDILVVTGSPQLRRRFLDSLISTVNRSYLYNLVHLQKVLPSRNRLLQWLREGRQEDLAPWDEQLIQYCVPIWLRRYETVTKLNKIIKPIGMKLLETGSLSMVYQTKIVVDANSTTTGLKDSLTKALVEVRGEEIRRATTALGPQRDDFSLIAQEVVSDKIVTKDIGIYGSRGEQRVAILSLKLAELDLIEKEVGERPLLLLDDVLSEFDHSHRLHLFSMLGRQQTFITTTDLTLFPKEILQKAKIFRVRGGLANEESRTEG